MTISVDGGVKALSTPRSAAGSRDALFEPVFQGTDRMIYAAGILVWAATMLYFWAWWLQPDHVIGLPSFLILTATIGWITIIPAYFILIFFNACRVRSDRPMATPGRIAMVVTKAPSEPFAIVRRTLLAMLDQIDYEFDVWLADEDPSAETIDWCAQRGIRISTRKGASDYHRKSWPRRTRCKEGNLAYFYDRHGYEHYDFVAQFDADHVPEPTYLREIIRPFQDARIGYVSAPSICDANAATSWSARGRLYAEASLHGALQVGYNNGWAPLCIGSHYAVRTVALKQIGGLGPELAEDHSTTLLMNAAGWKGAHAVDAIAHGDGPATFADLIVQEFQWSRSLVTILLQYSRSYVPSLPWRLRFQFLFSQLWYPLFSAFMALMFALPLAGLLAGRSFVNVNYPDFVLHFLPLSMVLIGLAFFWRASKMFRPDNAKIFGWEGILFLFLRWPWSLAGSVAALRDHVTGSFVDFRITPKGQQTARPLPVRVLTPYLLLAAICIATIVYVGDQTPIPGFALFGGLNAAIYATAIALVSWRHVRENQLQLLPCSSAGLMAAISVVVIMFCVAREAEVNGARGVEALSHGLKIVSLTGAKFAVAGAGQGGAKTRIVRFRWKWNGFAESTPAKADGRIVERQARPGWPCSACEWRI